MVVICAAESRETPLRRVDDRAAAEGGREEGVGIVGDTR